MYVFSFYEEGLGELIHKCMILNEVGCMYARCQYRSRK